jgi:hypothetical protein
VCNRDASFDYAARIAAPLRMLFAPKLNYTLFQLPALIKNYPLICHDDVFQFPTFQPG